MFGNGYLRLSSSSPQTPPWWPEAQQVWWLLKTNKIQITRKSAVFAHVFSHKVICPLVEKSDDIRTNEQETFPWLAFYNFYNGYNFAVLKNQMQKCHFATDPELQGIDKWQRIENYQSVGKVWKVFRIIRSGQSEKSCQELTRKENFPEQLPGWNALPWCWQSFRLCTWSSSCPPENSDK